MAKSKKPSPAPPIEPIIPTENDIPADLFEDVDAKIIEEFRKLNPKQQVFLTNYLKSDNATDACRVAYGFAYGDSTAERSGYRLLRNDKIRVVLAAFQNHRDDDLLRIRKAYVDGLGALKPIYSKDTDGQSEHVEDLPDHEIRIKAGKALADLHGHNAAEKKEITGSLTIQSTSIDEAL